MGLIVRTVCTSKLTRQWRRLKVSILLAPRDFLRCPQLKPRAWQKLALSILEASGRNARANCRHVNNIALMLSANRGTVLFQRFTALAVLSSTAIHEMLSISLPRCIRSVGSVQVYVCLRRFVVRLQASLVERLVAAIF